MSSTLVVFDPVHAQIRVLAAGLKDVAVTDMDSAHRAKEQFNEGKRFQKEVERIRKAYVTPLNEQVKLANSYAKKLCEDLDAGVKRVGASLAEWEKKCAAERAAALAKAEEEKRAKEEELRVREMKDVTPAPAAPVDEWDQVFGQLEVSPPADPMLELKAARERAEVEREKAQIEYEHAQAKKKAAAHKVAGTRTVMRFVVEDPLKVPREFLAVSEAAVRMAVNNGERDIPGIKIYEDVVVVAGRS